MRKYEYKIEHLTLDGDFDHRLNRIVQKSGWRVVSVDWSGSCPTILLEREVR